MPSWCRMIMLSANSFLIGLWRRSSGGFGSFHFAHRQKSFCGIVAQIFPEPRLARRDCLVPQRGTTFFSFCVPNLGGVYDRFNPAGGLGLIYGTHTKNIILISAYNHNLCAGLVIHKPVQLVVLESYSVQIVATQFIFVQDQCCDWQNTVSCLLFSKIV